MLIHFKTFGYVAGLFCLLVCFQNCSSYKSPQSEFSASSTTNDQPADKLPISIFMASGHMGRSVMSCDDGKTWINDRSDNNDARCWVTGDPNYVECDHQPTAGRGIQSGDGWFFTNYGWGANGSVRRSRDGINWQTLRTDSWGGGLAFVKGVLLLFWGNGFSSSDDGQTWTDAATAIPQYDHSHIFALGDKMMNSGTLGLGISYDQGKTWTAPVGYRPEWGGAFAEGGGRIVSVGQLSVTGSPNVGYAAVSLDNGVTWTAKQIFSVDGATWIGLVYNGTQFVGWADGKTWASSDGISWTSTPMTVTGTLTVSSLQGPVAFNTDTGTYAMISSGWGQWYDTQKALRSVDGIHWNELDADHYHGGHPITALITGKMDANNCP